MKATSLKKLRKKAQCALEDNMALNILLNLVTIPLREKYEYIESCIPNMTESKLRELISGTKKENSENRRKYGAQKPNAEYVRIVRAIKALGTEKVGSIAKYDYARLFSKLEARYPEWRTWPWHLRVAIDHGVERTNPQTIETELIEAKLYEDMCALFNQAVTRSNQLGLAPIKPASKLVTALTRATILSAYHLYEAYLNGIALDFLIEKDFTLPTETIGLLYEWDFTKNRSRYVKLRDKALKYPKIVIGSVHPPIQEDCCSELRLVLSKAKWYRDSIAHPSAALPISTMTNLGDDIFQNPEDTKESGLASITLEEATAIVDAVLVVIKKTDALINPTSSRVKWIHERDTTGLFPNDAFA